MQPPVELGDLTPGERDAVMLVYFGRSTVDQAALALATDRAGIGRRLARAYASIAAQVMTPEPAPSRGTGAGTSTGDTRRVVHPPGEGRTHRAIA